MSEYQIHLKREGGGSFDGAHEKIIQMKTENNDCSDITMGAEIAMANASQQHTINGTIKNNTTAAEELANRLIQFNNSVTSLKNQDATPDNNSSCRNNRNPPKLCGRIGNGSNNNMIPTAAKGMKPPPPPPPPRPSDSSSQSKGRPMKNVSQVGASSELSLNTNTNNNTITNNNVGGQSNVTKAKNGNMARNLDTSNANHHCNNHGHSDSGTLGASFTSVGDINKDIAIANSKKSSSSPKTNVGRVYNHNGSAPRMKDNDASLSHSNLIEDEAAQFKKFASMSLNDLDKGGIDNIKSRSNNNNNNNNMMSSVQDLNNSSNNFAPRPIRISQFDDSLDSHSINNVDIKHGKASSTTTTTESFVNSIRNNNNNSNFFPSTPVENIAKPSILKTPNSANIAAANTKSPSSIKSPLSIASVTRTVDVLPDHVDKKGRCLRHPNIKLFKKKILGGGAYEILCESCPNCLEAAPYETLWSSRAKTKGKSAQHRTAFPTLEAQVQQQQQRELWESSCQSNMDMRVSRERGRSYDAADTRNNDMNPIGASSPRLQSRSKERNVRSKSREGKSRSRERRRPSFDMPLLPSMKQHGGEHSLNSTEKEIVRVLGKPTRVARPPPPQQHHDSFQALHSQLPRRGRRRSKDRRPPPPPPHRYSESSVNSDITPASFDVIPPSAPTKSLFDKGIDTLSSLQNRARSSSRRRKSVASGTSSKRSARSTSPSRSKKDGLEISTNGVATITPPGTTKKVIAKQDYKSGKVANVTQIAPESTDRKLNFDKKTGRCKYHPSIILAKKSKFSKGWDIVKQGCPFCAEARSISENEFSKKKMSALLGGSACEATFENMKSYRPPTDNESNKLDGSGRVKQRHKSPARNQASSLVENCPSPEVSRMPYIAPSGESGWYTGAVNSYGKPHGTGRMRCKTGKSIEGEWKNGYPEEFLENNARIKSGFGTNVAPWKEDPRYVKEDTGKSNKGNSNSGGQMPPSNLQPLPYQGHQQGHPVAQPYYGMPTQYAGQMSVVQPPIPYHQTPQQAQAYYSSNPHQQQQQHGHQQPPSSYRGNS